MYWGAGGARPSGRYIPTSLYYRDGVQAGGWGAGGVYFLILPYTYLVIPPHVSIYFLTLPPMLLYTPFVFILTNGLHAFGWDTGAARSLCLPLPSPRLQQEVKEVQGSVRKCKEV